MGRYASKTAFFLISSGQKPHDNRMCLDHLPAGAPHDFPVCVGVQLSVWLVQRTHAFLDRRGSDEGEPSPSTTGIAIAAHFLHSPQQVEAGHQRRDPNRADHRSKPVRFPPPPRMVPRALAIVFDIRRKKRRNDATSRRTNNSCPENVIQWLMKPRMRSAM